MRIPVPFRFLLLGIVAACNDTDLSAPDQEGGVLPTMAAAGAATVDHGEGVFTNQVVLFLDCVGEVVAFNSAVPFRWRTIVTPSGRTVHLEPFIPNSGIGTAVGQSTGRVWTLERVVSPLVAHAASNMESVQFTGMDVWAREDGPTMQLHTRLHFLQNALGEVTVDQFVLRCEAH